MESKEDKFMATVQEIVIDWEFAGSSKRAIKKLKGLFAKSVPSEQKEKI
jgi:hypothetical protein